MKWTVDNVDAYSDMAVVLSSIDPPGQVFSDDADPSPHYSVYEHMDGRKVFFVRGWTKLGDSNGPRHIWEAFGGEWAACWSCVDQVEYGAIVDGKRKMRGGHSPAMFNKYRHTGLCHACRQRYFKAACDHVVEQAKWVGFTAKDVANEVLK